jgi:hypothetical protein
MQQIKRKNLLLDKAFMSNFNTELKETSLELERKDNFGSTLLH